MTKYFLITCLCLLAISGGCQLSSGQQQEATTFILVRHAEKAADGTKDPPLTPLGQQRAEALERLFSYMPIDAVYSSNYKRTQETARPIATQNELEVQLYEPHQEEVLLERLKEEHAGKAVAIIGHSNTIPAVVNLLLGEERLQELGESEYNKVFVVTVSPQGEAFLLPLVLDLPEATE